jgi:hypothetical protein
MIPTKKKQSERHFLRYRISDKVIVLCENRVDLDEMLDSFAIPSFSEFLVIVQLTMCSLKIVDFLKRRTITKSKFLLFFKNFCFSKFEVINSVMSGALLSVLLVCNRRILRHQVRMSGILVTEIKQCLQR